MIDNIDFLNSIQNNLRTFIITQYDNDNPFYDLWVTFDYKSVNRAFEQMNISAIDRKPVIHLQEIDTGNGAIVAGNILGKKVERNYFQYSAFCVVDDNIEANKDRKTVLNKLSSHLKYKFDKHKNEIPDFRNIKINYSEGMLGQNPDGLYASEQKLTFNVKRPTGR